jgi:4'-phosphopantetheinyl transferase
VWWALPSHASAGHAALLSPDELARRERLLRRADQDRLTVAYALARLVLAAHLGATTAQIRFERTCLHCGGPHGKPRLADADLRFSLSHSGDRVALAVARGTELGVDVEQLKPDLDVAGLSASVLSSVESTELAAVGPADRIRAFLTYWTRKEAVLKATGEGLQVPLKQLTVSGLGATPRLRSWSGRPVDRFQLHDLAAGPGHLGGLAAMDHAPLAVSEFDASTLLAAPESGR